MTEKIEVLYASDENYLRQTIISATSLLIFASTAPAYEYVIHLFLLDVSEASTTKAVQRLEAVRPCTVKVHAFTTETLDMGAFPSWRGGLGAYLRFFALDVLPELDWIAYFDADTLFCDDIVKFWHLRDEAMWVQGQHDFTAFHFGELFYGQEPIEFQRNYICSGVLLMNLKALRANDFSRKWRLFPREYGTSRFPDQSILNVLSVGHRADLPPQWGALCVDFPKDVSLIHYTHFKPWRLNSHAEKRILKCIPDVVVAWKLFVEACCPSDIDLTVASIPWLTYMRGRMNFWIKSRGSQKTWERKRKGKSEADRIILTGLERLRFPLGVFKRKLQDALERLQRASSEADRL
ncbi:MAG: glycosyltransferase [Kiritimatiellia bacterium]